MKLLISEILEQQKNASVLNYGAPKSGKTRALSTLPRPIWVFDFDWGADALLTVAKNNKWADDDLVIFRYLPPGGDKVAATDTRPRGKEVFMDFLGDFNSLYDHIDPKNPGKWKPGPVQMPKGITIARPPLSIGFDSLTAFNELTLDFVLNLAGHDLNAKGTDARADYGKQMGKVEETIISSNGLPCISVWNAHEVIDKDDTTGQIRCDPYVTGKLAARVARHFGIVLYSTIEKGQYVWFTMPEGYVRSAGTRYKEGLPPKIPQDYRQVL